MFPVLWQCSGHKFEGQISCEERSFSKFFIGNLTLRHYTVSKQWATNTQWWNAVCHKNRSACAIIGWTGHCPRGWLLQNESGITRGILADLMCHHVSTVLAHWRLVFWSVSEGIPLEQVTGHQRCQVVTIDMSVFYRCSLWFVHDEWHRSWCLIKQLHLSMWSSIASQHLPLSRVALLRSPLVCCVGHIIQ
jgi:hypothetical protein